MINKLGIFVCSNLVAEVAEVLKSANYPDVKLMSYPGTCIGSPLTNERILSLTARHEEELTKILFFVSSCRSGGKQNTLANGKIELIHLEQCFELFLNKEIVYHFIKQGYYLITNSWLNNYKQHIREWGFENQSAKVFFGESLKKILFIDTGISGDYIHRLETVSKYMGLSFEVLPVGLTHCRNIIDKKVALWRADIERNNTNERLSAFAKENADYSFVYQQLQKLVDYTNELEIVHELFSLLNILFAPKQIGFQKFIDGHVSETFWMNDLSAYLHKDHADYLTFKIVHQNEILGVFEVFGIKFPEYIGQYRKVESVISKICGVSISNARKYRIIHDQKEQLELSENRFKKLFHDAPLGIALVDSLNGKIYEVNPEFAKIAGRTLAEMENIDWMELTHPDDIQKDLDNMALMNAGINKGFQMNKRYLHKDGTPVWINMTIAPINLEDKANPRHLCMIEDITKRKQIEERLRKLSAAVEQSPISIVITNTDGRIEYGNPKVFKLTGYSSEELMGKNPNIFKTNYTSKEEYAQLWNNIKSGKIWQGEFLNKKKNGELYWENAMISPIMNEVGQITNFLAIKEDITERKQAEEKLQKLDLAIYNSHEVVFMTDIEGVISYINPEFTKLYGYTAKEIVGKKTPRILNSGLIKKEHSELLWNTLLSKQSIPKIEYQNKRKDGKLIDIEGSASPILNKNGDIIGFLGIQKDITERKKAEKALLESEEQFRSVLESVSLIGVMLDAEGRITLCNDYLLNLTGWSREDVMHQNWFDKFIPYEIRSDIHANVFRRTVENNEIEEHYENEIITRSGELRLIAWSNTILHNHLGEVSGVASIGEDITDRKRAEAEIRLKNDELSKLNAEKDKFFSIIAHDLRSPFSSFLGLTQIMAEDLPNLTMSQAQEFASSMRNSATNLNRLLENLLQWARIQQGGIQFHPEIIRLLPIVDESIVIFTEPARNKEVQITCDISANADVFADSQMLQTIIRNFVSNALKFSNKGGKIHISAKQTKDFFVEISVSDTGIGMNQMLKSKLFKIDENTSRKGTNDEPSTGLGLLLCKEFIEKHGGNIRVESETGKGSTFYFSIPEQQA